MAVDPALALSCRPQDVTELLDRAARAGVAHVIVRGRLEFDETGLPRGDWYDQAATPPVTRLPARLSGHVLGRSGEGAAFDREITLEIRCLGPWCAGARSGADYLAFLERRGEDHVLVLDPCGGMGLAEPAPGTIDRLRACLAGGDCAAPRR